MARPKVLNYSITKKEKKKHIANLKASYKSLVDLCNAMTVSHGTKDPDVKKLHTMIRNTLSMLIAVQSITEKVK